MGLFEFQVPPYVEGIVKRVGLRIIGLTSYGNVFGGADDKSLPSKTPQASASSSGNFNVNRVQDTKTVTSGFPLFKSSRLPGLDEKSIPVHNPEPEASKKIESETLEGSTIASVSDNFLSDGATDTAIETSISQVVVSEGEDKVLRVVYEPQASESIKNLMPIAPEMSNLLQDGANQTEAQKSNSRLFALIIGINKYKPDTASKATTSSYRGQKPFEVELPSFANLRGAVPDAKNFYKYLTSDLGVPSDQIKLLCDEEATRAEIVKAFQDLGEREEIRKGDSIVIFYAGHGAQALPPQRLSGTPGCPTYIELLVPHDYGKDPKNYQSKGIPDYTLAALLNGIAEKKGDNITVIFDCCHSASALRGPVSRPVSDDGDSRPIARTGPELHYRIPDDLDFDIWGGKRALAVLPRLRHVGSASYVFFAACASSELAKEDNGRGYFTSGLLSLLKEVGSRTLTCSEIISRIGKINDQSPQCEGVHTNRSIFHGFSPSYRKRFYNVSIRNSKCTVNAGTLDGLSQGDELTVYKSQSEDDLQKPLAIFVVDQASNRNSLLRLRDQPPSVDLSFLANPAPALLTKSARSHLRLHISSNQPDHVERLVSLVNRLQTAGTVTITTSEADRPKAHISLSTDDCVDLRFDAVGEDLTENHCHHFKYEGDGADEGLTRILRGLSDYYWHLTRAPPIPPASILPDAEISISFCKLRQANENAINPLFDSMGETAEQLVHDGDVIELYVDSASGDDSQGQDEFDDDSDDPQLYGVKVTNNSQEWDLYPALFYFDNRDFTIMPIYQPPLGNQKAESPLKKQESITIGYGAAGAGATVAPLYFSLPQGRKMDIGFLKLILSTEHIDLQDMVQQSPLFGDSTRALQLGKVPPIRKKQPPNWSSSTIKVVQRLRQDSTIVDAEALRPGV